MSRQENLRVICGLAAFAAAALVAGTSAIGQGAGTNGPPSTQWAKKPGQASVAGTPENQAHQRTQVGLSQADEKHAREILEEIAVLRKQGRYTDAAVQGEELLRMRRDAGQPPSWWEIVDTEQLVAHLRKCALLPVDARKELGESDAMDAEIEPLYWSARYGEALPLVERQLGIRKKLLDAPCPDLGTTLNSLGQLKAILGRYEEAEPVLRESLQIRRHYLGTDHPLTAETLNNLGALLRDVGKLSESERCHREAWDIHQRLEFLHPVVMYNLINWMACVRTRGDVLEAKEICRTIWKLTPKIPVDDTVVGRDHQLTIRAAALNNCAYVSDPQDAIPMYEQALVTLDAANPGPHSGKAKVLSNLASLSVGQGDLAAAEKRYREALNMQQAVFGSFHPDIATTWFKLAECMSKSGNSGEANKAFRRSLSMYERVGWQDHQSVIPVLVGYAKAMLTQQEPVKAEELLVRALGVAERARPDVLGTERERALNDHALQLTSVSSALAQLYVGDLNKPVEALEVLERGRSRAALDLIARSDTAFDETLGSPMSGVPAGLIDAFVAEGAARAEVLNAEGKVDETLKDQSLMSDEREERLAARRAAVSAARASLGRATTVVNELLEQFWPDARASRAAEIREGLQPGEIMLVYGWTDLLVFVLAVPPVDSGEIEAYSLVDGQDEVKQFAQQVERVRASLARRSATYPRDDVGRLTGVILPERLRQLVESARRVVVVPDGPLRHIPLEALAFAEQGNDQYVADRVEEVVYADSCSIYLNRRRAAQKLGRAEHPSVLVLADPVLWRDGEQAKYPERGAFLVEVAAEGNAANAGLRRGDVIVSYDGRDVTNAEDLNQLADGRAAKDGDTGEGSAKTVSVRYWREGETETADVRGGGLDATLDESTVREALLEARYATRGAADAGRVSTVPSSLDRWYARLGALRAAPYEAREIERTVRAGGGDAVILRREQANRERLEEGVVGKRYVHFATHGFAGSMENSLDPCVVLSRPDNPSAADGAFLTLDRLIRHWRGKLSGCELVVLSACDTQKGIPVGETIMSLPLGFFQAGAPSVVASLWEVDDEATALLMKRFYENLLGQFTESRSIGRRDYSPSQRMSKADALREAKHWLRTLDPVEVQRLRRELSPSDGALSGMPSSDGSRGARISPASERDYSHPYYWAAFVLIGDGGPID